MRAQTGLLVLTFALLVCAAGTAAQTLNSDLVYVHVSVKNDRGQYISGILKTQFILQEDNKPQTILEFSQRDPLSVGLIVHTKPDVAAQIREFAVGVFAKDRNPSDEIFIAETGNLPLNEAVYQTVNRLLQKGSQRKQAVVLFTSSPDPGRYPFGKVKELLRDQNVQFYVVGVPERNDAAFESSQAVLRELTELTGGLAFWPRNTALVERAYDDIAKELRYQYVIGYRPQNANNDGKWRKINVTIEQPVYRGQGIKLITRSRQGYYAPTITGASPGTK